jgi:hydroxymethylglutaryl-CoA synthase
MVGIIGYGSYIPKFRIKAEQIAHQWGKDAVAIKRGLMLQEKSVPGLDEDTITISVAAAKKALKRCNIDPQEIGALYIGSESHPYAVKPSGTVVGEALGIVPDFHTADFEFACKAGSEGMFVAQALVKAGEMKYAMAIGAHHRYSRFLEKRRSILSSSRRKIHRRTCIFQTCSGRCQSNFEKKRI